MSGYNGVTLYHRLGEQISSYAHDQLPDFVKEISDRLGSLGQPDVYKQPQTHIQRMAQSDRGHQNPGPGKKRKGLAQHG